METKQTIIRLRILSFAIDLSNFLKWLLVELIGMDLLGREWPPPILGGSSLQQKMQFWVLLNDMIYFWPASLKNVPI